MPPSCAGRFDRQKGDLGACTPCARKECKTPVILPIGMSSFAGGFVAARLLRSAKVIVICALISISIEYLLIIIMFKIEGSSMGQNESLGSYILTYLIVSLIYVAAAFFAAWIEGVIYRYPGIRHRLTACIRKVAG